MAPEEIPWHMILILYRNFKLESNFLSIFTVVSDIVHSFYLRRFFMKKVYFRFLFIMFMLSGLLLRSGWGYAVQKIVPSVDSTKKAKSTLDTYANKPNDSNKALKATTSPLGSLTANKPFSANNSLLQMTRAPFITPSTNDSEDDKILNSVIIYPNPVPVSEQLNLTYKINKDTNVTIKLMDVLGNEITTFLPSEHKSAGEWSNSFPIPSRLNSGMSYFVEVIAGKEIVVKRISII